MTHNHVNQAYEEHDKGNLIDSVHDPQVHIVLFLLLEQVHRIEVVQDFLKKHSHLRLFL